MRKLISIAAAGALLVALAGCAGGGGAGDGGDAGDGGEMIVGFAQVGAESGWRTANTVSVQEAFEEAGIQAKGPDTAIGGYAFIKVLHDATELPCSMAVYAVSSVEELAEWPEKGQRDRMWFSQADAVSIAFDFNLSLFLAGISYDKKRKRLKLDPKRSTKGKT